MYLTNFFSEKKSFSPSNKNKIRTTIKKICVQEKKELGFINCVFCSDEYLLGVNKKYLKHNFYTDVITFDFSENKKTLEGDLYISVDRVKENAKKYKVKFNSELVRTIIHGVLHLVGYKDKTKKEKETMIAKENKYVSLYSKN